MHNVWYMAVCVEYYLNSWISSAHLIYTARLVCSVKREFQRSITRNLLVNNVLYIGLCIGINYLLGIASTCISSQVKCTHRHTNHNRFAVWFSWLAWCWYLVHLRGFLCMNLYFEPRGIASILSLKIGTQKYKQNIRMHPIHIHTYEKITAN